jgi:phospholipid/cholesterol/gamma-HCH transport system substrate-binding protein
MTNKDKLLELKVGVFVLAGLLVIGVMAFKFGKAGERAKPTYRITVELPNANGILLNSDVMLAGAKVGSVVTKPVISPKVTSVSVEVDIYQEVKLPRQTNFSVGSSGLLGDRFVEIAPTIEFDPEKFDPNDPSQILAPGEKVVGVKAGGLDELTKKGGEVLDALKEEIDKLKVTTTSINERLLNEENLTNLKQTFANLNSTSANFLETSKNLNQVVQGAQGAVDTAKKTLTTADAAASDLRTVMSDTRKVLDAAGDLLKKAATGDGLIGALVSDPKLAEDLRALVANLRQRGVLFYRDAAPKLREPERPARRR